MATTGQIGGPDSQLGNIVLAEGATAATSSTVGKELEAVWNVRAKVATTFQAQWNVSDAAGVSLVAQWDVEGPVPGGVGKTLEARWSVQAKVTKTLVAQWTVQSTVSESTNPTLVVEIAFDSDPGDEVSVWTEVTDYVDSIYIKRGREEELDSFSAGTASIVLDNSDRRFDPTHTGSPYAPNVIPMRRCRIRMVQFSTISYNLYEGFIERWPIEWHDPEYALVTLELTDGFALLAAAMLPNVWELEVTADEPVLRWRLGDSTEVATDSSADALYPGTYHGSVTKGTEGLATSDGDSAVTFVGGEAYQYIDRAAFPWPNVFSIEFWIKAPATSDSGFDDRTILVFNAGPNQISIGRFYDEFDLMPQIAFIIGPPGGTANVHSTATVFDNTTHHVVCTYDGTTAKIFVDGIEDQTILSSASISEIGTGILYLGGFPEFPIGITGILDEFSIYDSALSAARVEAHYDAGAHPWLNDNSGTRVERILDAVGWPDADREVDEGQSLLQATSLNETALSHLQAVDATENGRLFITATGKLRFDSRHAAITEAVSNTSQGTFGDTDPDMPYEELSPEYSIEKVRNDIRVSSQGQSTQVAEDLTSQGRYLKRTYEHSGSLAANANELRDEADYLLSRYKDPKLRFRSMQLKPLNDPYLWQQVIWREIGDRVTVKKTPPGGGAIIESDVLIEGIEHSIEPGGNWTTTWKLSQEAAQAFWIWDQSVWDETTRWAY